MRLILDFFQAFTKPQLRKFRYEPTYYELLFEKNNVINKIVKKSSNVIVSDKIKI